MNSGKSKEKSWILKTDFVKQINGLYFLILVNKVRKFLDFSNKPVYETILQITPIIKVCLIRAQCFKGKPFVS